MVPALLKHNINLFVFDFSGSGISEGDYISLGMNEKEDLSVIVDFVSKIPGVGNIGLWGRSMGAATAMLYCKTDKRIKAAVFDSPFTEFRLLAKQLCSNYKSIPFWLVDFAFLFIKKTIISKNGLDIDKLVPIECAKETKTPGFFVHAMNDELIPLEHSLKLYEEYGGEKSLNVCEGGHNTKRKKHIIDKIGKFYTKYLYPGEEPERLAEIKGISQRKAMEIADQVNAKKDLRQAMIFLQQYGITMNLAVKIYNKYGNEIYGILKENPYRIADDIEGVGFRIADEIATKVGIRTDSDFRIRSGILYTLLQATGEGHTYLPMEGLTERARELLGVEPEYIEKQYMNMAMERKLVMQQKEDVTQIYSSTFFYMERNTASLLKQLDTTYDVPDIEIETKLRKIEKQTKMDLDEHQVEAVKEAVRNGLLVITGGPGTGKTTTINTIIRYLLKMSH